MLGPIIVSLVGVSLPIVAGMLLAPKRDTELCKLMLMPECRGCLRSLAATVQCNIDMKNLPAGLGTSSTYRAG
jgi:hypothetical protein